MYITQASTLQGDGSMAETLIMQDILNTPRSLRDTLSRIGDRGDELASALLARGARRLVALGNGTSYYASAASIYLHNTLIPPAGTLVWAVPTGDYALYGSPLSDRDALVGVSVSGEVVDLLDLFDRLRGRHRLVGITNVSDSTLTRLTDDLLITDAGNSLVPTSTKTFTATTAALYLLWLGLLKQQGVAEAAHVRQELLTMPDLVAQSLEEARRQIADPADRLAACKRFFVMGAGPCWAVAQEAALVLKEVSNVPAEAVQLREMAQGTMSVVDKAVGVIAVNPPGSGQAMGKKLLAQCDALGAVTLEIGATTAGLRMSVRCHDLLTPVIYSGPLFILANELALRRGVDADHPSWEAAYLRNARRQVAEPWPDASARGPR
jgi:glucosamine--fructose-6-phosphate aminotransferase (isomerizing)